MVGRFGAQALLLEHDTWHADTINAHHPCFSVCDDPIKAPALLAEKPESRSNDLLEGSQQNSYCMLGPPAAHGGRPATTANLTWNTAACVREPEHASRCVGYDPP